MAVTAYILVDVHLGKTQEVVDQLRTIPQIISAAVVTGTWDIVARIEVKDLEELYEITTHNIHLIKGIIDTQTAIVEKELLNE